MPDSPPAIAPVSTDTAGFVGPTLAGPFGAARQVASAAEFARIYGGDDADLPCGPNFLAHAVRHFFDAGGANLVVARVRTRAQRPPGRAAYAAALAALDMINDIGLLAAPGSSTFADGPKIAAALLAHAARRLRFAVLDPPPGLTSAQLPAFRRRFDSPDGALVFPWIADSAGLFWPPSGFICGTLARAEWERGVFGSAAGETVRSAAGLAAEIGKAEMDALNAAGVATLRRIAGRGIVLWGTRTLSSDPDWKYINIRRYTSFLENSIAAGTQWAAFEPNDETLWDKIRGAVSDFLLAQWRAGGFQGEKPEAAFFVRCDRTTMTQDDVDNGRIVVVIGVAPLRPAEFIILRIGQWAAR